MSQSADSVYQLIKSYEAGFNPPAPYVTIDVGTLNVDTGVFSGLTTASETDPEPVEHQAGQTPHSPPPHFQGDKWVSVTIDSHWKRTTTTTPAPHVPVAPVLLKFSVSRPVAGGWSVTANGETVQADSATVMLNANIWDSTVASWTIRAGNAVHSDNLKLQRPQGVVLGALGGFTIPVLPVTLVYAPPADAAGKSTATYTNGQTIGQTTIFDNSTDSSSTVPTEVMDSSSFKATLDLAASKLMDVFAKDPASPAVLYAGVLSAVSSQIGQLSASETTGITDESNEQMTVTTTTSTALSTNAAVGGPGQGDVIYFLHDVKMAWAYVDGRLRLAPLGYRNAVFPIATLQQQAASLGLSDDDVAALLAFDPFVAGGPGASLPTERFEERDTWEYQNINDLNLTDTVTRDTKFQDTHTDYSTKTSEWEAGPLLKALGFGEKDQTTVKVSNSTGSDVSTTITLDANLSAGPSEHFIVNVWYDKLFGTFAFQADTPAKDARLQGNGAKPGQQVRLSAGGRKFVTVADRSGRYAFFARSIPKGRGMVSVGAGLTRPVDIA